jgi:hypothetical protein
MVGDHIALLQLLQLKNGLQATIVLPEFKGIKEFELEATVSMHDDFWKYLFVMCCVLYAPICVLHLADQKTPAMDKLYCYVLQADSMLPKWLKDAGEHSKHLMSSNVWRAIQSAGLGSASQSELSEVAGSDNDSEYDTDSIGADDAEKSDENSEGDDEEIDNYEQKLR